jgi:hypothetical protein
MPEMGVRVMWALCLALGAAVTGVGIQLYSSGAGWVSYAVVAGGILFLPLASSGIERLAAVRVSSRD